MSENPKEKGPKPPFDEPEQQPPGLESEMEVAPDFGEQSYRGSGRLEGKSAVITGGDSGIGRAVALAFAREGADVLISYLNEEEDAQETRRVVESAGRRCLLMAGDIGDEAHCRKIIERAASEFGKIDVLINNAAFQMSHEGIEDIPSEEIEKTFRTNIFAMFYLCKAALPHLKKGSSIINTTSIQAYEPKPELLAYAATKGAIVNFTKGLNQQLIEKGIRVNAVAPGPVWTPLIPATMPPEKTAEFGKQSPLGRPAQPVELSPVYVFLASDEASYISGEVIGVTGGKPLP
ncbi:MAG TPA: SDR family oxidoreductase [Pyrinomonadaceae bacterium]|nr:SDR family oxidoreductase [Pyrinomonadaceae bacterium]